MKIYRVPVQWAMYGSYLVKANSKEDAIKKWQEEKLDWSLPEGDYLEDSEIIFEDEIEEELNEIQTIVYDACRKAYETGNLDEDLLKYIFEDLEGMKYNRKEVEDYFYELLEDRNFNVYNSRN